MGGAISSVANVVSAPARAAVSVAAPIVTAPVQAVEQHSLKPIADVPVRVAADVVAGANEMQTPFLNQGLHAISPNLAGGLRKIPALGSIAGVFEDRDSASQAALGGDISVGNLTTLGRTTLEAGATEAAAGGAYAAAGAAGIGGDTAIGDTTVGDIGLTAGTAALGSALAGPKPAPPAPLSRPTKTQPAPASSSGGGILILGGLAALVILKAKAL